MLDFKYNFFKNDFFCLCKLYSTSVKIHTFDFIKLENNKVIRDVDQHGNSATDKPWFKKPLFLGTLMVIVLCAGYYFMIYRKDRPFSFGETETESETSDYEDDDDDTSSTP